jgi:type II secretory pathway pseudopilin PulG
MPDSTHHSKPIKPYFGFTLAELIISIGVLGVMASVSIPKLVNVQYRQKMNTVGKEIAATMTEAHTQAKLAGRLRSTTSLYDLMTYVNTAQMKTSGLVDDTAGSTSLDCASLDCYVFSNGAVLVDTGTSFGGEGNLNALLFHLDPDGKYSGSSSGSGKAGVFFIYYNGRITSIDVIPNNTYVGTWNITLSAIPSERADWLTW